MRRLVMLIFLLATHHASASPLLLLDQAAEPEEFVYGSAPVAAQVFTVGRSGILTHIELPLFPQWETPFQVAKVHLLAVSGERPGSLPSDILASTTIVVFPPIDPNNRYTWLTFEGINLPVTQGDKFAIALGEMGAPRTSQGVLWAGFFGPVYDGGGVWALSGTEAGPPEPEGFLKWPGEFKGLGFRTFVAVPEPATLVMGCLGAFVLRRRK